MKHPRVGNIDFEPHDLWAAIDLNHFKRLKKKNSNLHWITSQIEGFKRQGSNDKWHGAKFALNPGTKALEWIWLHKTFPYAKFIFITRNLTDTWKSVYKQDKESVRGIIDKHAYDILAHNLVGDFYNCQVERCVIKYENLVSNADLTLRAVWAFLKVPEITGLNSMMKRPENWSV
jgi:hypothetical protein